MRVLVHNNNVDKAIRVLKKKLEEDGIFKELRERQYYESPGQRRRRRKRASIARQQRENIS